MIIVHGPGATYQENLHYVFSPRCFSREGLFQTRGVASSFRQQTFLIPIPPQSCAADVRSPRTGPDTRRITAVAAASAAVHAAAAAAALRRPPAPTAVAAAAAATAMAGRQVWARRAFAIAFL